MKKIISALMLCGTSIASFASTPDQLIVQKSFETATRTISKQMERCYSDSGFLVGGFHVFDDIDYDAKTGEVLYQVSGLAGKKTAVTVSITEKQTGEEAAETVITVSSGGALYNSTARRIHKQIDRWMAGDRGC